MSWWSWLFRPKPQPLPTCGVAVITYRGRNDGLPIVGARVALAWGGGHALFGTTNADGYVAFRAVAKAPVQVTVAVSAAGYLDYSGVYTFWAQNQDVQIALQLTSAPRRPAPALHHGNFCNLWDAKGRIMFDPYIAALSAEDRADWYARHRQAGSTHLVLSPSCAYNPEPWPGANFDWLDQPERFAALVREVLATPAADGLGFMPVIILDSGDPGFRERMQTSWRPIRAAIGVDAADCRVVPGWELVKASTVTSKEYSDALQFLRALDWPHIWAHLSVERAACSSNPLEPDDPWQGGESACWKSHGGEFVEGLLYQATVNGPTDLAWLDRWESDVLPRLCGGLNGWRIMQTVFFEGPAYRCYRGQMTSADAAWIAAQAQAAATRQGFVVGLGNGIP